MKNEASFKKVFKNSIKAHGGFSLSLAAPMVVGLPDLFITIPGYIPFLLEAKWMGDVTKTTFKRKINYSPLQKHFLEECNRVNNYSAFGLIGVKYQSTVYAIMTPFHVTNLTHDFEKFPYAVYSPKTKRFDLEGMVNSWDIPKINYLKNKVDIPWNQTKPIDVPFFEGNYLQRT